MDFFTIEPLTLMVSSRSADKVPFKNGQRPLAEVRRAIKKELEAITIGGKQVFKVWIHEDEAVGPGDMNAWDTCMRRAREADIFLVLYNGNAGWAGSRALLADSVGICHAEFEVAFNTTPSKIRSVQFIARIPAKANSPNGRFQEYFEKQGVWGAQIETGEEAIERSRDAAVAAMLDLARAGVGVNSRGSYFAGEALVWSRMDYEKRVKVAVRSVVDYLQQRSGREQPKGLPENLVLYRLVDKTVALVCHSIPASMSTASSREIVGQPFLKDYEIISHLARSVCGPVHIIACHKSVTEAQAIRQLGFPDAMVVSAPFGVYLADDVQKNQMIFVANCRDETTTRRGVQRLLQWLSEQGEDRLLAQRAMSRRKISDLIAAEQGTV